MEDVEIEGCSCKDGKYSRIASMGMDTEVGIWGCQVINDTYIT